MKHLSPKALRAMAASTALALSAMIVAAQDSAPANATPAAAPANTPQLSFGVPDVLKLSNAKVNDETIVSYVQYSGRSYGALSASEIVYLHEQGVSDRVVTAMLEQRKKFTEAAAQSAPPAAAQPAPPAAVASAPQYAQTPAPSTVNYAQSAPASSVYVIPNSPRYVDYGPYPAYGYYGYSSPGYGYYGYSYPGVSLSFGYYGGYRGGYYHGYHGGGYHGGGHHH